MNYGLARIVNGGGTSETDTDHFRKKIRNGEGVPGGRLILRYRECFAIIYSMTKNLIEDKKSTELEKKRLSKYAQSQSLSYTTIAVFFSVG